MIKKLFPIALLVIVILSSGCINTYNQLDYAKNGTYNYSKFNVSFNYPESWEIFSEPLIKSASILNIKNRNDTINVLIFYGNKTFDEIEASIVERNSDSNHELKSLERKVINNRTWIIEKSSFLDIDGLFFHTSCSSLIFTIGFFYEEENETITHMMTDSLQC